MKSSTSHLPSLFSSLLFIAAAMLFLSVAVVMGITALASLFTNQKVQAQQTIFLAISIFEVVLLLIATFVSIQRFRGQPFAAQDASFSITAWQVVISLIIAGIVIFIGYQFGAKDSVNWLLLPFLTLPAVALPIFILLGLAIRGLPLGTRWRSWNIFGLGMTLSPFFLIFIEAFALFAILFVVVAFLMLQPNIAGDLERLSRQIVEIGPQSEEAITLFLPYLLNPGVIGIALAYFAVFVPLIEEIFKPFGVWFYAKRLTSPAQGFALGALSGSAYALIETLGVSAQTADWGSLLLSRIGTGILHVTTSALMGAAIFYALHDRQYSRLLGIYLLSVSMHGLWNALAILYSFSSLTEFVKQDNLLTGFQTPLIVSMSILAGLFLIILILSNRRMRATLPKPLLEEPVP